MTDKAKLPWISVTERLPKVEQKVIFWAKGDYQYKKWFPDSNGYACYGHMAKGDGSQWWDSSASNADGEPSEENEVTYWLEVTEP